MNNVNIANSLDFTLEQAVKGEDKKWTREEGGEKMVLTGEERKREDTKQEE